MFMPHPFEVGKTYRNRVGEYVVLSIDGSQMKIRYVNGGTLATDVNVQGRIWENIQFEEQMSRAEERRRQALEARLASRAKTREARVRPGFAGFREEDFQTRKRGVAWTNRRALGKVLAYELSQRNRQAFDQWLVPHQAALHVARKDHYVAATPGCNAAFFVSVSDKGASYGLYVGKPDGKVQTTWPWTVFLAALSGEKSVRDAMRAAIKSHELSLDVYAMQVSYGLVGRITIQDDGFLWHQETAQQEVTQPLDWDEMVETLRSIAPDRRCELFLCGHLSAEDALKAGPAVAAQIGKTLQALIPVYDACASI
jgi:hypothetical protein